MDRPILKAVQSNVVQQIATRLPEFTMIEKPGSIHRQGGIFEFSLTDTLRFYIRLWANEYYNDFGFRAGWSEHGSYPYGRAGHRPLGCPEQGIKPDEPVDGNMCFDVRLIIDPCIGSLTRRKHYPLKHLPSSWYIDEVKSGKAPLPGDVVAAVQNAVTQAIDELITYVIPYFQKVALDHGYNYGREGKQD